MRRNGLIEALIVLLGGAIGYVLRVRELDTVFDEATGLSLERQPVTIALIVFSAAICVLLIASGLLSRNKVSMKFSEAFGYKSPVICLLLCLSGGVMIVAAGRWLMITNMAVKDMIWCILTVLSGFAVVFIAVKTYRGSRGSEPALATMMPVIALCTWLILSYTDRAADPVILKYIYEFFALAFAIMGFYYIAGFAFGKLRIRSTLVCSRIAVYFIMVNLAGAMPVTKKVIYICLALILLIQSWLVCRNANSSRIPSSDSQKPEPETPEASEAPEDFSGDFDWP